MKRDVLVAVLLVSLLLGLLFNGSISVVSAAKIQTPNVGGGEALWYDLKVNSPGLIGVETTSDATDRHEDINLYLYNPAGKKVISHTSIHRHASITYNANTTGTYKVKVYLVDTPPTEKRTITTTSTHPLALIESPTFTPTQTPEPTPTPTPTPTPSPDIAKIVEDETPAVATPTPTPISSAQEPSQTPWWVLIIILLLVIASVGVFYMFKGRGGRVDPTPQIPTPSGFPPELQPGYTNIEFIGKGGFARVFKAKRKRDSRVVAVKIPISLDETTGKSFMKEIKAWEELKHPNIVELYDMNIMPTPYFEMEYVEGGGLERVKKPLDIDNVISIILNIAEALRYAHGRGVIHRDLKPHNILLTEDMLPKITDWGLSRVLAESKTSSIMGFTPAYAAPEQVSPEQFEKTDERTDVWQLGVIFYELSTGKPPFIGENIAEIINAIINNEPIPPSEVNPDSKSIEHIIMKCLRKKKDERYQSVDELIEDLEDYRPEDESTIVSEKEEVQETTESPKARFCPECGNELEEDAIFCTKCGYKVKTDG